MPEFSYQKGQLWRSEFMALELLSKQNLNVDKTLSIQFKARKDQRDIRPLTYKGRIAFGGIVSENAWLFRSSILAREGRTQPVEQLAGSEMAVVEDTDSSALPPSADVEAVTGAKKFEQLGEAAYAALLDAAIEGVPMDGRSGIVVVDLNMGTGDVVNAWINRRKAWTIPAGYVGFTDDRMTKEWITKCFTQKLAKMHLDEDFPIPGIQKMSTELPADLVAEKPKKPTLNVLVGGGSDGLHPVVPDALSKVGFEETIFLLLGFQVNAEKLIVKILRENLWPPLCRNGLSMTSSVRIFATWLLPLRRSSALLQQPLKTHRQTPKKKIPTQLVLGGKGLLDMMPPLLPRRPGWMLAIWLRLRKWVMQVCCWRCPCPTWRSMVWASVWCRAIAATLSTKAATLWKSLLERSWLGLGVALTNNEHQMSSTIKKKKSCSNRCTPHWCCSMAISPL